MSHRMKITLSQSTLAELRAAALENGEPMARLATRLISVGLSAGGHEHDPQAEAAPATATEPFRDPERRAPWLEPFEGEREWRGLMWGGILALYRRYPRELGHLRHGWWNHASHVETLCALVVWRDWIDEAADDPRHELAFHAQLEDYSRALRQEGGGARSEWRPGAAPPEWLSPDRR
jgi:hypothetical protein